MKEGILIREVYHMATSSITKNFVVYGEKQAEIFANAIEESDQHGYDSNQGQCR